MSTTISQSISDIDMEILKYQILDLSNENNPATMWVSGSLDGKINNAYKSMKNEWVPILMDDSSIDSISASKDGFVAQVVSHSSYKTRYQTESGSYRPI
jgi:hypothetical protein